MLSDRVPRSARRVLSGEPLTLLLIAVSILGGIGLAIACSYRPIALWWVMIAGSAMNAGRFVARRSLQAPGERRPLPRGYLQVAAVVNAAWRWLRNAFGRTRPGTSKASLDRQHTRFLVWFTEHNLLWTSIGFLASLVLWYRFGPTAPALILMAALMSCGLLAALGAAAGASAPMLGLCWREPCRTPAFRSIRGIVHDIGCVVVLTNRRDYAARSDWAKGGRFHELFLTVDDLARAGVEPGLEAVLDADDAASRRQLARKERLDRALALTPVFAVALLASLLAVPPLAGSEPLPSLWTILGRSATASAPPENVNVNADDNSRDLPATSSTSVQREQGNGAAETSRSPSSQRASGDSPSSASPSGSERPDLTGQSGASSITGDAVASAPGDGAGAAGADAGAQSAEGSGDGGGGAAGSGAARDGRSDGPGGRGGGSRGYGTGGVAPQRAESPTAVPDAPVNPGKAIEVVLPPFSEGRDDTPGDEPAGIKRKAEAPDQARAPRTGQDRATAAANEPATREPVQRWPNWVFKMLKGRHDSK